MVLSKEEMIVAAIMYAEERCMVSEAALGLMLCGGVPSDRLSDLLAVSVQEVQEIVKGGIFVLSGNLEEMMTLGRAVVDVALSDGLLFGRIVVVGIDLHGEGITILESWEV